MSCSGNIMYWSHRHFLLLRNAHAWIPHVMTCRYCSFVQYYKIVHDIGVNTEHWSYTKEILIGTRDSASLLLKIESVWWICYLWKGMRQNLLHSFSRISRNLVSLLISRNLVWRIYTEGSDTIIVYCITIAIFCAIFAF